MHWPKHASKCPKPGINVIYIIKLETQFLPERAELLYHMLVKLPSIRLLLLHLRYIAKKHVGAKEGMAERNQAWGNYTIFLPSNDALEILEKSWKKY